LGHGCLCAFYVGRTESHEQFFLHATWEQQTKEYSGRWNQLLC
jgi:hypothetical protein